nr:MAG TPA: hypothetical protein [Caudoviricetes sp.]
MKTGNPPGLFYRGRNRRLSRKSTVAAGFYCWSVARFTQEQ